MGTAEGQAQCLGAPHFPSEGLRAPGLTESHSRMLGSSCPAGGGHTWLSTAGRPPSLSPGAPPRQLQSPGLAGPGWAPSGTGVRVAYQRPDFSGSRTGRRWASSSIVAGIQGMLRAIPEGCQWSSGQWPGPFARLPSQHPRTANVRGVQKTWLLSIANLASFNSHKALPSLMQWEMGREASPV